MLDFVHNGDHASHHDSFDGQQAADDQPAEYEFESTVVKNRREGTFHYAALPKSVARWQEPEGEYEDILLVFSCLLKCERARCGTVVAVSGSGGVHQN